MRGFLIFLLGVAICLLLLDRQNAQKETTRSTGIQFDDPQKLLDRTRPATFFIESDKKPSLENPSGESSVGTGFFISEDGYALTAYHVVELADTVIAITSSKRHYTAKVVGFDAKSDLAVLKVNIRYADFLWTANQKPRYGDSVLAIGNSGGEFLKAKYGKVVDFDVRAQNPTFPLNTFETTAPLAPGDSGGPIVSNTGHVLGVVSYIRTYEDNTRSSYGVPMWSNQEMIAKLKKGFKRAVPIIGIRINESVEGAVVVQVFPNTPAAKAGIRSPVTEEKKGVQQTIYDTITAVDGIQVNSSEDFRGIIRQKDVGDTVNITLNRDGEILHFVMILESQDTIFNGE